ncbi:MAG TPA: hypothetical protein VN040_11655 [Pseudosphingobacterium sp.]|nr:hypothetical protein [Pseudosphingobacterium sp.]
MNNTRTKPDWDKSPFMLALNSIRKKGFKPTDVINKFWERYSCWEAVAKIVELFWIMEGRKCDIKSTEQELEDYVKDLINVMMAYYFSHQEVFERGDVFIDIEKSFPIEPKYQREDYEMILKSLLGFF